MNSDLEYQSLRQKVIDECGPNCYQSDNYYAYEYDKHLLNITSSVQHDSIEDIYKTSTKSLYKFSKYTNFVPCYDKWCLNCGSNCSRRCSGCKSVFFCSKKCQKVSWHIHQKHCSRDLFKLCIQCGQDLKSIPNSIMPDLPACDSCPVKFCSNTCKDKIYKQHVEYDCSYFTKVFGKQQ